MGQLFPIQSFTVIYHDSKHCNGKGGQRPFTNTDGGRRQYWVDPKWKEEKCRRRGADQMSPVSHPSKIALAILACASSPSERPVWRSAWLATAARTAIGGSASSSTTPFSLTQMAVRVSSSGFCPVREPFLAEHNARPAWRRNQTRITIEELPDDLPDDVFLRVTIIMKHCVGSAYNSHQGHAGKTFQTSLAYQLDRPEWRPTGNDLLGPHVLSSALLWSDLLWSALIWSDLSTPHPVSTVFIRPGGESIFVRLNCLH